MALCSRGGEGRDGALQSWSAYLLRIRTPVIGRLVSGARHSWSAHGSVSAKSTSTRGIEAAEAAWTELRRDGRGADYSIDAAVFRLARARYEARPEGANVRQRDCRDDHLHLHRPMASTEAFIH